MMKPKCEWEIYTIFDRKVQKYGKSSKALLETAKDLGETNPCIAMMVATMAGFRDIIWACQTMDRGHLVTDGSNFIYRSKKVNGFQWYERALIMGNYSIKDIDKYNWRNIVLNKNIALYCEWDYADLPMVT